jgi:hypothetical protein
MITRNAHILAQDGKAKMPEKRAKLDNDTEVGTYNEFLASLLQYLRVCYFLLDILTKPKRARVTKESVNKDFPPRQLSLWKVGAHVSSAGGVQNAVVNAAKIGCVANSDNFLLNLKYCTVTSANAFAIFVKSQRKWSSPDLTPSSITSFKERMQEFGYPNSMVLPHGSYLINLGNPDMYSLQIQYYRHCS